MKAHLAFVRLAQSSTCAVALALLSRAQISAGALITVPDPTFSIQSALNSANPGDTVLVGPGTYNERLDLTTKQVFMLSLSGSEATTIDAGRSGAVIRMTGNGSEVSGFTITGGQTSFGAGINIAGGAVSSVIRNNVFQNNFQTAGGFGAAIGGNSSSPLIENNVFRNNTSDFQFLSGVISFVNTSSPVIQNNLIYDNASRGINLTLPAGTNPLVINNTIDGNRCHGLSSARIERDTRQPCTQNKTLP
ncbi:MAG: right-handed parallel beta-helix repeat-containing protein [Verrucomicrobiota bacterium]|nr:right-handed parallel beta-helix repeat-containing protein [Verrucomicrobiota bacterium]